MTESFEDIYKSALDTLNERQRAAVECIDGPLLVIAGPGTGKTQLLSTRAAHILHERAVGPKNILCLTYTDAGARAMSDRLIRIIGQDAYEIEVATFHSFAQHLSTRYPEFFSRSATATLISDLRKNEIIDGLLNRLSINSAGKSGKFEGVNSGLRDALSFIDDFQKSGLSADKFRDIAKQTISYIEIAEKNPVIKDYAINGLNGERNNEKKIAIFDGFTAAINQVYETLPKELKASLVKTPGIYTPYATYFTNLVNNFDIYADPKSETGVNEKGNAVGVASFRTSQFNKDAPLGHFFKDYKKAIKSLDMIDVYEQYVDIIQDEDLYSFDDIINDAIAAIENNAELQTELAMRYEYIQVDEFQDTNGSQMRLLQLVAGKDNPNVMAVGDDDQAIMRFQGATIECIEQFKAQWNPKEVFLNINYRSAPNIIDLGQTVAKQIEGRLDGSTEFKNIVALEGKPDLQTGFAEEIYPSEDVQYFNVVKKIQDILSSQQYLDGIQSGRIKMDSAIGVIAPKHACLQGIIPYLDAANISYSYKIKCNVFKIESMQTLLATMRFAAQLAGGHKSAAVACLPQIIAAPENGISHEDMVDFAIFARANYGGDWYEALKNTENKQLLQLEDKLSTWAALANSGPVRQLILDMAQNSINFYNARQEDVWNLIELNSGIRALLRFIEQDVLSLAKARALRLSDVVERIDKMTAYGLSVDTVIEVGDNSAVHLNTIHGSKGLEYEWVFLIDAEDSKWHFDRASNQCATPNVYMSLSKDEDDHRRALFVAITRAKNYLMLTRGTGQQIRELAGCIETKPIDIPEDALSGIIQTSWLDGYALDEPRFVNRLIANIKTDHLSVSKLNKFVTYAGNEDNFAEFLVNGMLRIPSAPFINAEFGTLMHSYLNMYVKNVICSYAEVSSPEQIKDCILKKIELLDFPEDEVSASKEKFEDIIKNFVPNFEPFKRAANGKTRLLTEVSINAVSKDGVPLFGFLDLIEIDDANKCIYIHDFKTGKYNKDKQINYDRQLLFYKYLVEQSGDYEGYSVCDCTDYYIEHVDNPNSNELDSYRLEVDNMEYELEHLERLITAAWKRIQSGNFDNSKFVDSEQMKEAKTSCFNKGGGYKPGGRAQLQRLYEDWLIAAS